MLPALTRHRQEDQGLEVAFSYIASLRPLLGYRRLCVKKEKKCLKAFPDGDKGKKNWRRGLHRYLKIMFKVCIFNTVIPDVIDFLSFLTNHSLS